MEGGLLLLILGLGFSIAPLPWKFFCQRPFPYVHAGYSIIVVTYLMHCAEFNVKFIAFVQCPIRVKQIFKLFAITNYTKSCINQIAHTDYSKIVDMKTTEEN